jgi:hypothetical protein
MKNRPIAGIYELPIVIRYFSPSPFLCDYIIRSVIPLPESALFESPHLGIIDLCRSSLVSYALGRDHHAWKWQAILASVAACTRPKMKLHHSASALLGSSCFPVRCTNTKAAQGKGEPRVPLTTSARAVTTPPLLFSCLVLYTTS